MQPSSLHCLTTTSKSLACCSTRPRTTWVRYGQGRRHPPDMKTVTSVKSRPVACFGKYARIYGSSRYHFFALFLSTSTAVLSRESKKIPVMTATRGARSRANAVGGRRKHTSRQDVRGYGQRGARGSTSRQGEKVACDAFCTHAVTMICLNPWGGTLYDLIREFPSYPS